MTQEKTQAEAALTAATAHHQSVTREMRNAITEEQKKIEARYAPLLAASLEAKSACTAELDRINVALAASNPLIGRKVHLPAQSRTWRNTTGNAEAFGVLEAYKPGDDYAGNRPPAAGEIIVQLLKKDGAPSARHKAMSWKTDSAGEKELPYGWVYIDTDAA